MTVTDTDGGVARDGATSPRDGASPPVVQPTGGCRVSDDCIGSRCQGSTCVVTASCKSDLDCQGAHLVCNTTAGLCVDCNVAADCNANQACVGHSCMATEACTSSKQCPTGLLCAEADAPQWPASVMGMACQECGATSDCPSTSLCSDGLCSNQCTLNDVHCGPLQDALGNTFQCGTCSGNAQCVGPNGCMTLVAAYPSSSNGFVASQLVESNQSFVVSGSGGVYRLAGATKSWTLVDDTSPYQLMANSTYAVWIDSALTVIKGAPIGSGAVTTIASPPPGSTNLVAVDERYVYTYTGSQLGSIPIASNATLTPLVASSNVVAATASNGTLYYANVDSTMSEVTLYSVTTGGQVKTLCSPQPYFSSASVSLVTDGTYLYFEGSDSTIYRLPVTGGALTDLYGQGGAILQLAAGGLFFESDQGDGLSVVRLDLKSDVARTWFTSLSSATYVDGNIAYVADDTGVEELTILGP